MKDVFVCKMYDGVEKDRQILRYIDTSKEENIREAVYQSLQHKAISYVPNLINREPPVKSTIVRPNIKKLTAKELLALVHKEFSTVSKDSSKFFKQLHDELLTRENI